MTTMNAFGGHKDRPVTPPPTICTSPPRVRDKPPPVARQPRPTQGEVSDAFAMSPEDRQAVVAMLKAHAASPPPARLPREVANLGGTGESPEPPESDEARRKRLRAGAPERATAAMPWGKDGTRAPSPPMLSVRFGGSFKPPKKVKTGPPKKGKKGKK